MTKEQALAILKQPDRIGCHLIKANDEESNKYNQESIEALNMAIKALEQNNEEIYKAGYEDGVHDGYYSSSIKEGIEEKYFGKSYSETLNRVDNMPPVTPTHGTCKDCKYCEDIGVKGTLYCKRYGINHLDGYYCADYEKRGSENE